LTTERRLQKALRVVPVSMPMKLASSKPACMPPPRSSLPEKMSADEWSFTDHPPSMPSSTKVVPLLACVAATLSTPEMLTDDCAAAAAAMTDREKKRMDRFMVDSSLWIVGRCPEIRA